jgi:two-component system chemotaxis response regulator CheY
LAFLRGHQKYRDLPVLVLTTRGDESSRTAAMAAGATAFMTKPFVPDALASQAQALLAPAATPEPR